MQEKTGNRRLQGIVCGVLVGLANSVFGGGGGMIAVPLLKGLGLSEKEAHATAILVILPISILSFLLYAFRGFFQGEVSIPAALGVCAGGLLGAKILQKATSKWVGIIFAILQAFAGAWLLLTR